MLFNLFGGIVDCSQVAQMITKCVPVEFENVIVSLKGNNSENAKYLLESRGIKVFSDMEKATEFAVQVVKRMNS